MTRQGGVLDMVKEQMPWLKESGIINLIIGNDAVLAAAGTLDIEFNSQPAQSPDLNINDLGFFSFSFKNRATNIDQLLANIKTAYEDYDGHTLDKILAHQIDY